MNIQQQLESIFNGTGVHLSTKVAESFVAFPYFELGYVANAVLQPREKNAIGNASIILQNDIWLHYLLNHQKINKLQHNNNDPSIAAGEVVLAENNYATEEVVEATPIATANETSAIAATITEVQAPMETAITPEEDVQEFVAEKELTTNHIEENTIEDKEIATAPETEEEIVPDTANHTTTETHTSIPISETTVDVAEKVDEPITTVSIEESAITTTEVAVATPDSAAAMLTPIEEPLAFEPYHTVDYFASQGIKLQQITTPTDKLGQQLKSFTEWLKDMKKVTPKTVEVADNEIVREHVAVVHLAENSLQNTEIVTETMADVLIKQGKTDEAIVVFQKLSLQDSSKSAYFATRIEQLKSN